MIQWRVIGISEFRSGQKPWWSWYLTPVVNLGEVRRAQLAKSSLLISMLVPLGSFKVCLDAKERVGCGKQRKATAPIKSLVKLQPEFAVEDLPSAELQPKFLRLQWRKCLWAEHSYDDIHKIIKNPNKKY